MTDTLVTLQDVSCGYGSRVLWSNVDFSLHPGQCVAVLGPNGAGKTSLLKLLLRQLHPLKGRIDLRQDVRIGYVPQLKDFQPRLPLRGQDLVGMGLDGRRYGLFPARKKREIVAGALAEVQAEHYAHVPVNLLSGGERQRLRIAQALVAEPDMLLMDEPLLSLDIVNQKVIIDAIDRRRSHHKTACICVTHDVNPFLPVLDTVMYVAKGRMLIGSPQDVLTTQSLSALYDAPVRVVNDNDHIFVVGGQ